MQQLLKDRARGELEYKQVSEAQTFRNSMEGRIGR